MNIELNESVNGKPTGKYLYLLIRKDGGYTLGLWRADSVEELRDLYAEDEEDYAYARGEFMIELTWECLGKIN